MNDQHSLLKAVPPNFNNMAAVAAMAASFGFAGSPAVALHQLQQQARVGRSSFDAGAGLGASDGSSPLSIPLEYTPETAEAKLVDYRGEKVAAFEVDSDTMICLPQAYELFLKHLVGGLHTVYTKLKRLEITPFVCNVEQVRALRSIGAIQPGVNRCKLISCRDFDILYEDCASSSSRPGRPPKRSPLFSPSVPTSNEFFSSLKRPKMASDGSVPPSKVFAPNSMASNPMANFVNTGPFNPNLFTTPLFPLNPMLPNLSNFTNLFNVRSWNEMNNNNNNNNNNTDDRNSPVDHEQKIDVEEVHHSRGSTDSTVNGSAVNLSKLTKPNDEAGVARTVGTTMNGDLSPDGEDHEQSDSDEQSEVNPTVPSFPHPFNNHQAFTNFANAFVPSSVLENGVANVQKRSSGGVNGIPREDIQYSSVQNLLLSVMGLIEVAAATARKQEEQLVKEKLEIYKAFDGEKQERSRLEKLLKEEQRAKMVYLKRWRHAKRQKNDMQNQVLTMLEQQNKKHYQQQQQSQNHSKNNNNCTNVVTTINGVQSQQQNANKQQDSPNSSTAFRSPVKEERSA